MHHLINNLDKQQKKWHAAILPHIAPYLLSFWYKLSRVCGHYLTAAFCLKVIESLKVTQFRWKSIK